MVANDRASIPSMKNTIRHLPLRQSTYNDPFERDLFYEAWDCADKLLYQHPHLEVSPEIRGLYALGYYDGQVKNGGHSQLIHNIDIQEPRSAWLYDACVSGSKMIGVSGIEPIVRDLQKWIRENPQEAFAQTGFEDGRANYLDTLDNRYMSLDAQRAEVLQNLIDSSKNEPERCFLMEAVSDPDDNSGILDVLVVSWIYRGGVFFPVPDEGFEEAWKLIIQ